MDIYQDEDDDEFFPRPFEQGIWEWSNAANQLNFIRTTDDKFELYYIIIIKLKNT